MKQIIIEGNHKLSGEINISGAKNSAVALIPAAILSDDIVIIDNVPNISDIDALIEILEYIGAKVTRDKSSLIIDSRKIKNIKIPEKISSKLRASYYFMSTLLGRFNSVDMYFPGGCNIGARPIDQTIKAFKTLGAKCEEKDNEFHITAHSLKGGHIYLDMPSVGATINSIFASVKAKGKTIIDNAAKEPEIVNVATLLNNMGAHITGAGTSEIEIIGVEKLGKAYMEVIPDRIEAGTYLIAGALIGENLKISNLIPEHIESLTLKLQEMGIPMEIGDDYIIVSSASNLKSVNIKTLGYPGFPTDLQQPVTTLLLKSTGTSIIEETIYENRFNHIFYLNKMGAKINIEGRKAYIKGPINLKAEEVVATDLRAGACMVLAGLIASGKTIINSCEHILRGYENIIEKLTNVGAKIELKEI